MCSACHEKFSYSCTNCRNVFTSKFPMVEVICRACGEYMKRSPDELSRFEQDMLKSSGVKR